jgi:hypothetical protein
LASELLSYRQWINVKTVLDHAHGKKQVAVLQGFDFDTWPHRANVHLADIGSLLRANTSCAAKRDGQNPRSVLEPECHVPLALMSIVLFLLQFGFQGPEALTRDAE